MDSREAREPEIMNVRQMIDTAFGDLSNNTVNFKLIQTVMFLLARQLNFLERRVYVAMDAIITSAPSNLRVTELKIKAGKSKHSEVKVATRSGDALKSISKKGIRKDDTPLKERKGHSKSALEKTSVDTTIKFMPDAEKQRITEYEPIDEMETDESSKEKRSSDKNKSVKRETKYVQDPATDSKSGSKDATDTGSKDKLSIINERSSSRTGERVSKSTGDEIISSDDINAAPTADRSVSVDGKSVPQRGEPSTTTTTDRTTSIENKSLTQRGDQTATSATEQATVIDGKRVSQRDDHASTRANDSRRSSVDKSFDASSSYAGEKATLSKEDKAPSKISDQRYADKNVTDMGGKPSISEDKNATLRADRTSSGVGDRISTSADKSSNIGDKTSSQILLGSKRSSLKQSYESQDSQSAPQLSPQPQLSSAKNLEPGLNSIQDKFETRREKLLRVIHQRKDSLERYSKTPTPIRSIDSKEAQFERLLVVERISSDAAMEKIASAGTTPKLSIVTREQFDKLAEEVKKIQERFGPIGKPEFPENAELMGELRRGASLTDAMAALQLSARLEASEKIISYLTSTVEEILQAQQMKPSKDVHSSRTTRGKSGPERVGEPLKSTISGASRPNVDFATYDDLEYELTNLQTHLVKLMADTSANTTALAQRANLDVANLGKKLSSAVNLGNRMVELEDLVHQYAEQITIMDTGLSAQMTNYQEQLTQMQHDLEVGVETMMDVLANSGTDTVAIAELNANFTHLQSDVDEIVNLQKEFKEHQRLLGFDLANLWKDLEILREAKSDRDEVADALRDKAGIADLNGLVSSVEFDAVIGDFEKRINAAYDKFNNQEIIWQKAIDDLVRELSEKSNVIQVESLASDIASYLNIMNERIQFIVNIIGEPKAAALTKKLFRDTTCLSCARPAEMDVLKDSEEKKQLDLDPDHGHDKRKKPKGAGDGLCYPGYPVTHPVDPRGEFCNRYCGGAHTSSKLVGRVSSSLVTTPIRDPKLHLSTKEGTDGRMYAVDEEPDAKPCLPCKVIPIQTQQRGPATVTRSEVNRESLSSTMQDVSNIVVDILHCKINNKTDEQKEGTIEIIMQAPRERKENDDH